MGGFSAQVQQPQTNQPNQSMGKGGGIAGGATSSGGGGLFGNGQTSGNGYGEDIFGNNQNRVPSGPINPMQLFEGLQKNQQQQLPQLQQQSQPNQSPNSYDDYLQDEMGFHQNFQPQQPQQPQAMGKGGVQTNSATSGQPRAGMPNQYSNTVGQWDNARIQPQQSHGGGKGKG
jgi:hypothetical protein